MNEWVWGIGGMILTGETEVLGEKHVPLPFYPRGRVVLEKLTVPQLVKKFPSFDETIMFLTEFKKAATCPYPEASESGPHPPHTIYWTSIFTLSSYFHLGLQTVSYIQVSPSNSLPHACHMPYTSHLSYFITRLMVSDEQYKSWSYLLCSFIQFPFTSSLFGPKIFLNTLFQDASIDHKNNLLLLYAAGLTLNLLAPITVGGRINP